MKDGTCRDCGEPVWWHDNRLIARDAQRWCFGPDRQRMAMTHWHALPGMPQYIVPSPPGQVCHCLDRASAHIHQIIEIEE